MPDDALALAARVNQSPKLHLQGIATHFCCLEKGDLAAIEKGNLDNQTALQSSGSTRSSRPSTPKAIGLDAIIHAGSSDALRFGVTPICYNMLRIGTMLSRTLHPEHRTTRGRPDPTGQDAPQRMVHRLRLPRDGEGVDTRVGLVAHVPNDEVTYFVRARG